MHVSKILLAFAFCTTIAAVKCSGQSKAEIRDAKARYLNDTVKGLRAIDSLYYRGLVAIHHDTHGLYTIRNNRKHYLPQPIKTAL